MQALKRKGMMDFNNCQQIESGTQIKGHRQSKTTGTLWEFKTV